MKRFTVRAFGTREMWYVRFDWYIGAWFVYGSESRAKDGENGDFGGEHDEIEDESGDESRGA
jgi:hypothetical protein